MLYPLGDLGEVFVLLTYVVFFAKVDKVDNRFRGEQEERVYYFNLEIDGAGSQQIQHVRFEGDVGEASMMACDQMGHLFSTDSSVVFFFW